MVIKGIDRTHWLGLRMVLAIAGALLLPLSIYILVTVSADYRDARRATERATLTRSQNVANEVASRLKLVVQEMRILATIRSIQEGNWREAQSRSRDIAQLDPDWRDVTLIDLQRGVSLFDLHAPVPQEKAIDMITARKIARLSAHHPMVGEEIQLRVRTH